MGDTLDTTVGGLLPITMDLAAERWRDRTAESAWWAFEI